MDQKVGGVVRLSQTRPIPRSPDGDKKLATYGNTREKELNLSKILNYLTHLSL